MPRREISKFFGENWNELDDLIAGKDETDPLNIGTFWDGGASQGAGFDGQVAAAPDVVNSYNALRTAMVSQNEGLKTQIQALKKEWALVRRWRTNWPR
jgi:hypothetical protein